MLTGGAGDSPPAGGQEVRTREIKQIHKDSDSTLPRLVTLSDPLVLARGVVTDIVFPAKQIVGEDSQDQHEPTRTRVRSRGLPTPRHRCHGRCSYPPDKSVTRGQGQ